MKYRFPKLLIACGLPLAMALSNAAPAQIAGQTAADGPFVIDDFEDLDMESATLQRTWLASVIVTVPAELSLAGSGLTLASGQTPNGAIRLDFPDDNAFIVGEPNSIFGDLGIPMPGVAGASTDPNAGGTPGGIEDFAYLEFLQTYQLTGGLASTTVQAYVLIECYPQNPDTTFPTLRYAFTPTEGTTFQPIQINLVTPTNVTNNQNGLSLAQLLSQVRFLDIFYFATPVNEPGLLDVHIDDVTLTGISASEEHWELY